MSNLHTVETKLAAARTKLILDQPFLGALVLRLPMQAAQAQWCPTAATDARRFFYNPEYIQALSVDQVQFVLAHEALHCALSHFARRQHRQQQRWDLACDFAINPLLIKEGLTPPPEVNVFIEYEGMTAEEIYPFIEDHPDDEPMDKHVYEGEQPSSSSSSQANGTGETSSTATDDTGGAQPQPLTEVERSQLAVQWQQRLAGAAQQALQAGKLGGSLARLVDHLLQPQLPWRMLLARYMTLTAREDYTYMRPSRREGSAILPHLRSAQLDIIVALDTSGSISDAEMNQCLAEIDALKGQLPARVTLLACDAQLAEDCPWIYEPWEVFAPPRQLSGGGGTCFIPVFDYVQQQGLQPDLLVYFTDAEGEFPEKAPHYPVVWLVKGKHSVPWGQRIQLN